MKDIVYTEYVIRVKRVVEQKPCKDGLGISNKTKMRLIDIKHTTFDTGTNARNSREFWKILKDEIRVNGRGW